MDNMNQTIRLFVPGRLCLFGEHTDWAGNYMAQNAELLEGQAIVTGINLGIYAEVTKSNLFEISSYNEQGEVEKFECEMDVNELHKWAKSKSLFSYCCGVAAYFLENYNVRGLKINVTKVTLPMKKGLSSSAAICVLVAKAFNEIYNLNISTHDIMQCAYRGELLTGSRCGRLDQACAYGEQPVMMRFAYGEIEVDKLRVGKTLYWVVADLCAGKNTKKILAHLNRAYPFYTNEVERKEQEALGVDNHEIIAKACIAIENGDAEILGNIMNEAQRLFDEKVAPVCPDELNAPVLHSVLDDPNIKQWIYGAKGVGSQGDGSVQLLAKDKKSQEALINYLNLERNMVAFPFTLNAGGKVRKAIIPIAGLGTRMFPETFFTKKAFLPVVDRNGVVKPVLLQMLEELYSAEIEEIYLIIGENEEEEYNKLFHFQYDKQYEERLPSNLKRYYELIHEIGSRVRFIVQYEKKGFGHAIFQAYPYVKDGPVVLMLGDFIYRSNLDLSCVQQTINGYYKSGGKAVASIKQVPFEESKNYGIIHGTFLEERPYLMNADNMIEKPTEEVAKMQLAVDNACFATFGQYVLTPEIFKYLESQIEEAEKRSLQGEPFKEIDLTAALCDRAIKGELVGVKVDGLSFDVGIPEMYYKTFTEFAML